MSGSVVVLTGFTINGGYKNEAQKRIEKLKWVTSVVNEVKFLPVEPGAQEIRTGALAILQQEVPQSFPQNHANIRIEVDKMVVTLVGFVEEINKLRLESAIVQIKNLPLVKDVKNEILISDK
jgi:osmotically-inducible protein OsmY